METGKVRKPRPADRKERMANVARLHKSWLKLKSRSRTAASQPAHPQPTCDAGATATREMGPLPDTQHRVTEGAAGPGEPDTKHAQGVEPPETRPGECPPRGWEGQHRRLPWGGWGE